jgi:hypothetical protein
VENYLPQADSLINWSSHRNGRQAPTDPTRTAATTEVDMVRLARAFVVVLACSLLAGIQSGPFAAGTPQGQAPGRPYSGDCSVVMPKAQQLAKGLAVQEEAMRRAAALIEAAKGGTAPPSNLPSATVDSSKSVITSLMSEGAALRQKLEALKLTADASAARTRILKDLDNVNTGASLVDVLLAGGKYQQAMAEVNNLRQLTEATGSYLMDSGLADMLASQLGGQLAGEALGGPAGVLIVQAAALGIDVGARLAEQEINASELRQAQDTYDALKYQYDAVQARIQFMVDNCAPSNQPEPKSSTKATPPPASKTGTGTTTSSRPAKSAGQKAAAGVLLGGGVAAVVWAAGQLGSLTTTSGSGCDTSKAPINEINTYCFGSTRNTALCNQYVAQYDSFCKSCGYSGFDVNQGKCK